MQKTCCRLLLLVATLGCFSPAFSQAKTNSTLLKQAAVIQAAKEKALYERLKTLAAEKGWQMVIKRPNGGIAILAGVDESGAPLYLSTDNNSDAAATIGTNKLWPGGPTGLNLNGSSASVKDKLGVWDGGRVLATHVELAGRILQKDNPTGLSDHSTHVAGTLVASGVNPLAKGMSFGQQELICYDFSNDGSEMLSEAANLLVSNHSYGFNAGWNFNESANRWEFLGRFNENKDYKFGYYSVQAQLWDSIAYNAPYYLIVKSAGNNRNENGPAVGANYWRYNASGVMSNAGARPDGISSNDGYDILSMNSVAKNVLIVGAVNAIPGGYTRPQDVVQSSFSSWGPTDDGRIKPDVVADGVNLLSSISSANDAYGVFSGTSMASPNASGSLLLLQEYYSQLHPNTFMRSATLKGLVIHTADEAGPFPGPDYQNGWGLINMARAASVITANNTRQIIQENVLNNGGTLSLPVIASGDGKISATLSWTDPKAEVESPATLDNPARKLVNDLDIVIKRGATTYRSWILDPASPANAATTGDNVLDNVEKIELPDVVPGATYTIEITHKGTLARGQQAYSLIASGVGGQAYCASAPGSNAGARIDSVSFGNIQNKNIAGCTTYSNFTGLTGNLQPSQIFSFFARLNSCDATTADKIVKVYIDANNDGDFSDNGENIGTSNVINGNADYSANLTVPAGLSIGKYTLLRVVMVETNNAADVTPCGTYTRGETQDYRILITAPQNDVGITELVNPKAADCSEAAQYVTVRISNFGTADVKNIPITTVIKQGATTIATLNYMFADTIFAGTTATHTFQAPFTAVAGTTYTFTSSTSLPGDQDASNNQLVSTVVVSANSSNPAGTATICNNTAILKVTNPGTDVYTWYTASSAIDPLGYGANVSTSTMAGTYYLSKNDSSLHVGPSNKMAFTTGSYLQYANSTQLRMIFTTSRPLTLETARMYFGQAGTVTLMRRKITNFNYTTGAYNYYPSYDKTYTINAHATAPTVPTPGAQMNNPSDLGEVYHLGIDIPEAGEWAIMLVNTGNSMVYRNNTIATNPYPYTIPNVISLTGNGAVDNSNPSYYQQFYYFFYDIKVQLPECPSGRVAITPTTATPPVITQNGNVLTTAAIGNYQWYKGGILIPGAVGQSYTVTENGTYKVEVTDADGCTLASNDIVMTVTAIPNIDPAQIGLVVSPNPVTTGQFDVRLKTTTRSRLTLTLVNASGQKAFTRSVDNFIGQYNETIKPGKLAGGVYYLQVQHDNKMYIKKLLWVR